MVYNTLQEGFSMLKGIRQSDSRLSKDIQKWGCLFLCFANASPMIFEGSSGITALNKIWKEAVRKGYISGDLNRDGDCDDDGESEIINHDALANEFFALSVRYDGKHRRADEKIPDNVVLIFGKFVYISGHFAQLNKSKKVIFDSFGTSNTVLNGKLESMRWYFAT
jgi:hypothetical protein